MMLKATIAVSNAAITTTHVPFATTGKTNESLAVLDESDDDGNEEIETKFSTLYKNHVATAHVPITATVKTIDDFPLDVGGDFITVTASDRRTPSAADNGITYDPSVQRNSTVSTPGSTTTRREKVMTPKHDINLNISCDDAHWLAKTQRGRIEWLENKKQQAERRQEINAQEVKKHQESIEKIEAERVELKEEEKAQIDAAIMKIIKENKAKFQRLEGKLELKIDEYNECLNLQSIFDEQVEIYETQLHLDASKHAEEQKKLHVSQSIYRALTNKTKMDKVKLEWVAEYYGFETPICIAVTTGKIVRQCAKVLKNGGFYDAENDPKFKDALRMVPAGGNHTKYLKETLFKIFFPHSKDLPQLNSRGNLI